MTPRVVGCDPSLTGFAVADEHGVDVWSTPASSTLRERCGTIFVNLARVLRNASNDERPVWLFVEGPIFASYAQATNLYDRGYLSATIDDAAEAAEVERVFVIQPKVLKKFTTGTGNADKVKMAMSVWKKWKVEFERDAGSNKVDAYALYRYGLAVASGEIEHEPNAKRGARKIAAAAGARKKAGVA
jgi:Holliday junction resolvasome RuvABC endonuclease subunit